MNCPNCGAAMRMVERHNQTGQLLCDYCRFLHVPEPDADGICDLDQGAGVTCPVCSDELVHATIEKVPVVHCRRCRGLLIEMDAFVVLTAAWRSASRGEWSPPQRFDPVELERQAHCPRCRKRMQTHPYGGPGNIVIDNCPDCQLNWLDHAELRRVAASSVQRNPGWLEVS